VTEGVDNLVLEQLGLIRQSLGEVQARMDGLANDLSDLKSGQNAQTGMTMALAGYVRDIDVRVEHVEQKLGIQQ
jgi:hypothetical protein